MAAKKSVNVRLSEDAFSFFSDKAVADKRTHTNYCETVLETVAAKGYTWQDLEKLPAKTK